MPCPGSTDQHGQHHPATPSLVTPALGLLGDLLMPGTVGFSALRSEWSDYWISIIDRLDLLNVLGRCYCPGRVWRCLECNWAKHRHRGCLYAPDPTVAWQLGVECSGERHCTTISRAVTSRSRRQTPKSAIDLNLVRRTLTPLRPATKTDPPLDSWTADHFPPTLTTIGDTFFSSF